MNMPYFRVGGFFCLALIAFMNAGLWAQQGGDDDTNSDLPIQPEWDTRVAPLYSTGDKNFTMALGPVVPLFVTGSGGVIKNNMKVGGTGSLAYTYFFTPKIFFGGELEGAFMQTLGDHFYYIAPISLHTGWQFIWGRFEFPVSFSLGIAPQFYSAYSLFGIFAKIKGAAYYRFFNDWSLGINTSFWWVPQWTKEPEHNAYGHFLAITISLQYHF